MERRSLHEVRPDAFNYVWDNSIPPELEVESGAEVELHVRDAGDEQIGKDSGVDAVTSLDFSHVNPVSGPVAVKGAKPGDVLAVEILELRPGDWGWTAIIPGFGLLADEFPDPWLRISAVDGERRRVRFGEGITLPFEPFPGTIGVAMPEPGEHSIVPPSNWGGNLDIKHLRVGTTLYLPVGVEGALFSVGDTHAAMGDGEVCGTAVETAMDIVVRLSVRRDFAIAAPQFSLPAGELGRTEADSYHVTTGVGPDLFEATRAATRAMIDHLGGHHGLGRQEAYALCSVACDLRVHEVVDQPNWVVGMFLPESILGAAPAGI
ncbi:MAG TPA: acetamidase/formamidase family protein [Gaiellales bacterium]|jgi:acetamidase/formamidase